MTYHPFKKSFFKRSLKLSFPAAILLTSLVSLAATSNAHSGGENMSPSRPASASTSGAVTCEIAVAKTRYGHTYTGIVHTETALAGSYKMHITKSGNGGHSVIKQAGNFSLKAGASATLGQATFGGLPSNVDAELILNWSGEKLSCTNHSA
jgi:hypothetical protein